MVRERQSGDALLSEAGTSGTIPPSSPKKRGKSSASYKAGKQPYKLSTLILQAVESSTARKGISLAALKKQLVKVGYNVQKNNSRLKRELNNLVSSGLLVRVTGTTGLSGSFKTSRRLKNAGKAEPGGKAAAAKKSPKANRQQLPKKTQKKQLPIKPKNLPKKKANSGKKNPPNHPAGLKKGKK